MGTPEQAGPVQVAPCFATDITSTSATLWGAVSCPAGCMPAVYLFMYSTSPTYSWTLAADPVDLGSDPSPQLVTCQVSGLTPATTYRIGMNVNGPCGTTISNNECTFVTSAGAPVVTMGTPTNITSTTATLHGTVYPGGLATTYGFEWGTTTTPYGNAAPVGGGSAGSGSAPVELTQPISGLTPATTYHFILGANNSAGNADTADATFTTADPKPTVTTGNPTAVGINNATLHGTVNPMGLPTTYHWEYGTTTSYGESMPVPDASAGSGTTPQPVTYTMPAGLQPGTAYHCRIVATNSTGTAYGNDVTFHSANPPSRTR